MPEQHLFEYAVIRVVPRVEREEFINVGVIVSSIKGRFLRCKIHLNTEKLKSIDATADMELIESHLMSFKKICAGGKEGGPIGLQDLPSRFRWLTAARSTVIQTSKPHAGLSDDLYFTLERLFYKYVG